MLQYYASTFALPALSSHCLRRGIADFFECKLKKLTRDGRTLDIFIYPHLLRHLVPFFRVYNSVGVGFGPQVSLEADDYDGKIITGLEVAVDLFNPLKGKH